jgi:hypothetical protein
VAPNPIAHAEEGPFLLELLHLAGWQLRIRSGKPARIRATRDGIVIDVTDSSLSEAAGIVFARAMRSRHDDGRSREG